MERFTVYVDISPGYVVFDTQTERVVALCSDVDVAMRAAERLNEPPLRPARVFRSAKDVADARVEFSRLQLRPAQRCGGRPRPQAEAD